MKPKKKSVFIKYLVVIILLFSSSHNFSQTENQKNKAGLFLYSDLDSVQVFINDSLVGKTPVKLINFPTGTYNIDFVHDTLVVHKYNVFYQKDKFYEIYGIFAKDKGLLSVNCNENNAGVFLNDSLIGYTPLVKKYIPKGVYNLSVRKKDFFPWEKRILVYSRFYKYESKLKYKYGSLQIEKNNSKEKYFVDGKLISGNLQKLITLPIGKHSISVQSINYHKMFDETFDISSKVKKNVKFNYGVKTYIPLFYSAIIPGLGQVLDNSSKKGYIIMATNLVLGGTFAYFSSNFNSKLNQYKKTTNLYENELNISKVLKYKRQMLKDYDETKKALRLKNYSMGIFLASYLYNLIDAYFNHSIGGKFIFKVDENFKTSSILLKVRL